MSEASDFQSETSRTGWKPGMDSGRARGEGRSMIGPTVVIRGEVTAEEDLLVMGRVEGFIDHSRTVTVHPDGVVAAEVKAQEVLIEGTVDGNVYGTKRVEIAETGRVNGNVFAPRVGVLEGASFKGAIDMDPDVSAIERRFRVQTGTESRAHDAPAGNKSQSAKSTADEEESNAAQAEEKGNSDDAAAGADAAGV